jgi:hypothetical protein
MKNLPEDIRRPGRYSGLRVLSCEMWHRVAQYIGTRILYEYSAPLFWIEDGDSRSLQNVSKLLFHQTTRCYAPENRNLNTHLSENLKHHILR